MFSRGSYPKLAEFLRLVNYGQTNVFFKELSCLCLIKLIIKLIIKHEYWIPWEDQLHGLWLRPMRQLSGFTEKQWETNKMKNWGKPTGEVDIVWHSLTLQEQNNCCKAWTYLSSTCKGRTTQRLCVRAVSPVVTASQPNSSNNALPTNEFWTARQAPPGPSAGVAPLGRWGDSGRFSLTCERMTLQYFAMLDMLGI